MGAAPNPRRHGITIALIVLTFGLFPLWGVGHRLYDTLLPQFATLFSLHGFALAMAGGLYSILYFVGAFPAALCARRFGYKTAIVIGLGLACMGAFLLYPAGETKSFAYFLSAAAIMSLGWIQLEVAANPLVIELGSRKNAVQRLNLAQSFYVPGSLAGVLVGNWLLKLSQGSGDGPIFHSLSHPYIIFAAILLIFTIMVEDAHFPPLRAERDGTLPAVLAEMRRLVRQRLIVFAIVAQAFSVVAMASTWTISSMLAPIPLFTGLGGIAMASLVIFGAGRFFGAGIMRWIAPERVLTVFAACGAVVSLAAFFAGNTTGAVLLLVSNFFLSILWPTILGLAIRDLRATMKIATALICMGGAVGGFAHRLIAAYIYPVSLGTGFIGLAIAYGVVLAFAIGCERFRGRSAALV